MSDLIDRQAAIDALIAEGRDVDSRYLKSERIIHESDAVETISMLPTAEPKIIRCKDCDWWTKQDDSMQGRCARFGMYPTGYWYCAGAKFTARSAEQI